MANALRSALGPRVVAALADLVYDVEDRWNRLVRHGEQPKAYWPPAPPAPATSTTAAPASGEPGVAFHPGDVGPMFPRVAAPGDGVWVPVADPEHAGEAPILYKTLIHPDVTRPWAELFVVAIDASRVRLSAVAGLEDPEALTPEGRRYTRRAIIPATEQGALVAAFNGGWKTEHGQYGMRVDGVVLVPPKDKACVTAVYEDDSLRIATWTAVSGEEERMRWWRQTPPCLYENGSPHAGLSRSETRAWGAAVGGETVIRRSALGLNPGHRVLFMGVSNATTAPALADGMHHAGASDVAELDVNWSFPKFLVFRRDANGQLMANGLFDGFDFDTDEYVRKRSTKDFFYVLRRSSRP